MSYTHSNESAQAYSTSRATSTLVSHPPPPPLYWHVERRDDGEKLPTSSISCSSLPQGIQNLEITHGDEDPTPTNSLHQVAPATSQPRKRSRINTNGEAALAPDNELPDILPYINKRARPSLDELGHGAYVKLRNIQTKYVRWETTLSFLKKYSELKITPAYLRLTPILPFSRDNVALQNRWSARSSMTRREGFSPCWLTKQTGSGLTKRSKSSTYAHNWVAMSPTTKSMRKPLQPFKRSQIARRNKNWPQRWNASSETWTQGIKNPHRIFPNRTAGTPARKTYDKQVQEEPEISTSPTQGKTRENLPRRCRVTGPNPKTPEVKPLRTYAQVLAQEDNKKNVPNQGRFLPINFCTNSAFPQATNRNNNNNDENSATNSGQNEQCKTFVGTPINIDMKCLDEFSVINLSDYSLNQTDLRLLSKGLTFTPAPDVANIGEIKSDLDRFLRKIRLRLYFSEEISEDEPSSSSSPTQTQVPEFEDTLIRKFRNKSNWSPKNQDAQVETYIRTVITEFQKLKLRNPPKTNLTQEEKQTQSPTKQPTHSC